jgi:hypothetical protein
LHFAILIGGAYTGVDGATHVIIVHYCRTLRQDVVRFIGTKAWLLGSRFQRP